MLSNSTAKRRLTLGALVASWRSVIHGNQLQKMTARFPCCEFSFGVLTTNVCGISARSEKIATDCTQSGSAGLAMAVDGMTVTEIGATRKICFDLVALVNAESTMARLSDGLGNSSSVVGRVHILTIHRNLRAVDDIEVVARFLSGC
jgi:hypothetical protein